MDGGLIKLKQRKLLHAFIILSLLLLTTQSFGMGLRSFVALPIEQGGMVFRLQNLESLDDNKNIAIANFAYGITGKQTLLFGMPYRLSPSGSNRSGDVSVLYRYTAWQKDFAEGTYRLGLLGGGLIPTNNTSDGGAQGGAVATFYKGRHELDFDALWGQGFGKSLNRAQYDASYQFRLSPAEYPESGLPSQWNAVIEYNGRWQQTQQLIHQATLGLQWVHPTWVLEGGIIHDLNAKHDNQLLLSIRYHW